MTSSDQPSPPLEVEPAGAVASAHPANLSPSRPSRWRRVLTVVLVVLSCLTVLVSSVSIWAHRTVFDTDRWVATVGPLARNDAVITSASEHLTRQLDQVIDSEQIATRLLPPQLQGLAGPISDGVTQIVRGTVTGLLHSEAFQQFWTTANREIQRRVVAVLRGEPTSHLQTANGTIELNLLPLVAKALTAVESRAPGLLPTNGPIPQITNSMPADQARAELGHALGRTLPSGFGTVTLLHSEQLASAQHLVHLFDTLIVALVVVTVALMAATVLVAQRRRRALIALALGIVVSMGIAYALTRVITNQVASAITNGDDRAAVRATVGTVVRGLDVISAILIGAGLVVAVVGFFAGPSRLAASARRQGADVGRSLVGRTEARPVPPVLSWICRYRMLLWMVGLAAAVVVLVAVVDGWVGLLATVLVLAAYEGLVAWMARSGRAGGAAITTG